MSRPDELSLIQNIHARLPELEAMMEACKDMWGYEDSVYRFYHQSFKVFHLQGLTLRIVESLRQLLPARELNPWFVEIVNEGTGKQFSRDDNKHWLQSTRPIVEAFFHAHYFLEMICKYGKTIEEPPNSLPSGWAAVLYLYNMR
jgi:hypothetical protein